MATREDFEQKRITLPYLKPLVEKHLSYIADHYQDELAAWIEAWLADFPYNCCELATAVLLDRIGEGVIVYGRYEHEPINAQNMRKSHAFWAHSEPVDEQTLIADITADQYGGPAIYVGDLHHPWTVPDWTAIASMNT